MLVKMLFFLCKCCALNKFVNQLGVCVLLSEMSELAVVMIEEVDAILA
jgi:hypothetical protein